MQRDEEHYPYCNLNNPPSTLIHPLIPDIDSLSRDEYIDMESLDHGFREFFTIDAVFFAEREMDPDLALVEVDIR